MQFGCTERNLNSASVHTDWRRHGIHCNRWLYLCVYTKSIMCIMHHLIWQMVHEELQKTTASQRAENDPENGTYKTWQLMYICTQPGRCCPLLPYGLCVSTTYCHCCMYVLHVLFCKSSQSAKCQRSSLGGVGYRHWYSYGYSCGFGCGKVVCVLYLHLHWLPCHDGLL